jgi:hypothetical protein
MTTSDTGVDNLADFIFAAQQKAVTHKRMGHPVATQVMYVHAYFKLGRIDFL